MLELCTVISLRQSCHLAIAPKAIPEDYLGFSQWPTSWRNQWPTSWSHALAQLRHRVIGADLAAVAVGSCQHA